MKSKHNHTISQMNPNNKTCYLTDEIELAVLYSFFNLLASFYHIVCVAFMPRTPHKTNIHTYTEGRGSSLCTTLREPFYDHHAIEITFHPILPKNR